MNDELTPHDIDERGHAAGVAVMRLADARPIPELDPDTHRPEGIPPRRDRRWRIGLAVAAAMVVIAGAGVLWLRATDDGDEPDQVDTPGVAPLVPYVADDLPDDLEFSGAASTAAEPDPSLVVPLDVYGTDLSSPLLGVGRAPKGWLDGPNDESGESIDVAGRTGQLIRSGQILTMTVKNHDGSGVWFSVRVDEAGLGRDGLERIAERLVARADGSISVPDAALPDGLRYLGTEPNVYAGMVPRFVGVSGMGEVSAFAVYTPSGGEVTSPSVEVSTARGSEVRLSAVRLFARRSSDVTVNGHAAVFARSPGPPQLSEWTTVTWIDESGQLVRVFTLGLDRDEVLDVAASVRPASEAEWAELLRRTPKPDSDSGSELEEATGGTGGPESTELATAAEPFAEGEFDDGTSWTLVLFDENGPSETVSLMVPDTPASSGFAEMGSRGSSVFKGYEALAGFDRSFAAGLVTDEVDSVELRADGATSAATMVRAKDRVAWVGELPTAQGAVTLVARDARGMELERTKIEAMPVSETESGATAVVKTPDD